MVQPRPLPEQLREKPFSTRHAQRAGVSRSRLRRGDLAAPFHGVREDACLVADDVESRCRAYLPVMHPRAFFSHATAAALIGLPLPNGQDGSALHVTTPHPVRAPKGRGIAGHSAVGDREAVELRGLPVAAPVEAWVQLASLLSADELVVTGDALVRRKQPYTGIDDLESAVAAAAGRPGVSRLRDAIVRVRARTDSPMETILRLAIVRAGMPEPFVNYAICGRGGRTIAHGDLVFPDQRLVVEYDGDHHRTSAAQYRIDIDRLRAIDALGWRVIRITHTHMRHNAREALTRIQAALTIGPNTPPRAWS
jgi:hypothetical protein